MFISMRLGRNSTDLPSNTADNSVHAAFTMQLTISR